MVRQGSRARGIKGSRGGVAPCTHCAFTLIELLVVIVIIGLLIMAIYSIGGKVMHTQKVRGTDQIMRTIAMAIGQFTEQNPLRNVYDMDTGGMPRTFGPYPPYQLYGVVNGPVDTVREVVDPFTRFQPGGGYSLGERLWWDLGQSQTPESNWVSFTSSDANDDIHALYTYLKVYCAGALAQVPADAIKPLGDRRYVNPAGKGTDPTRNPPPDGLVDVLGFVDAWGVALDYFLYVKLEWTVSATGGQPVWRVTDRVAALRSRGVAKEKADAKVDTKDDWIFSSQFPSPEAGGPYAGPQDAAREGFRRTGVLNVSGNTRQNGWARAVGAGDLNATEPDPNKLFGYLP